MNTPPRLCLTIAAFLAAFSLDAPAAAYLRYPPALEANLFTVCWTGTQFVAGGQGGAIITSPDGLVWTPGLAPLAQGWLDSAAGGGQIVLVGHGGACISSTDGITWTPRTLPGDSIGVSVANVAFNGTLFAATAGSEAWFSQDAFSWALAPGTPAGFAGLAVNGNQFASLDFHPFYSQNGMQRFWTSTGGPWTPAETNIIGMRDIVWTGARYVAAGVGGAVATAIDGVNWTPRNTGVTTDLKQVMWSGAQAVAVGASGTIITSPNGAAWTVQTSNTTRSLESVAWSGTRFVAVGGGGVVLSSPNGVDWTIVKAPADPVLPFGVGWTGNTALAAGPGGTLISSDGITWTRTGAVNGPYSGTILSTPPRFQLASGAGRIVAAVGNGQGLWSCPPDGSSWSRDPTHAIEGLGVVWDGQKFAAHFSYTGVGPVRSISTSPDGLTWTHVSFPPEPFHSSRAALTWTGQRYVTTRAWSTNLMNWTRYDYPPGVNVANEWLFWTGSKLVGVSSGGVIMTSPDGTVWTTTYSGGITGTINDVTWTGSMLLAVAASVGRTYQSGLSGPWVLVNDHAGDTIAWTGTRALVADGFEIYSLEGPKFGMSPWVQWLSDNFNSAQLGDPAITGPLADPDKDGQANLVEHATGTNPLNSGDAFTIAVLPSPQGARIRWPMDTGLSGVTIKAQISFDLNIWDDVTGTPVSGDAGGLRIMESLPFPGQTKVFFRLKVDFVG